MNEIQDIFNSEIELMKNKKNGYLELLNQSKIGPLSLPQVPYKKSIED